MLDSRRTKIEVEPGLPKARFRATEGFLIFRYRSTKCQPLAIEVCIRRQPLRGATHFLPWPFRIVVGCSPVNSTVDHDRSGTSSCHSSCEGQKIGKRVSILNRRVGKSNTRDRLSRIRNENVRSQLPRRPLERNHSCSDSIAIVDRRCRACFASGNRLRDARNTNKRNDNKRRKQTTHGSPHASALRT